jgi:lipoate-protein ligase A
MNIVLLNSTNPQINLATEEFLLKNNSSDFILLYSNAPSIIVGKHQNSLAEINHFFIQQEKIEVVRRISGGGTVFHDLQNLNFSFLLTKDKNPVNFRLYSQPIVDYLVQLGTSADFSPRNDIFINEFKVSGNAEHIFKNRVLHHGTLLFNSNLEQLNKALNVRLERYNSKAIQSVRRNVANIAEFLPLKMSYEDFRSQLFLFLKEKLNATEYKLCISEKAEIQHLAETKYSNMEWNYAYSPKYEFSNSFIFENKQINVTFAVEKGIIGHIKISGTEDKIIINALKKLESNWHLPESIKSCLEEKWNETNTRILIDNLV